MTVEEFKKFACEELENSPSPALDANVFLERFLHFDKTQILLNRKTILTCEQLNLLSDAVKKRKTGLPVAYITGYKEFFGFDFMVSPDVLIPKPDTEILVQRGIEIVLEKIKSRKSENGASKIIEICDMCSGSGCVALAVAKSLLTKYKIAENDLPNFTLVDISSAALKISMKNADFLKIPKNKVRFIRSNLFEKFSGRKKFFFDAILTNPPYVPHRLVDELLKDGRNEPRLALDGDVCAQKKGDFLPGDFSQTDDGLEIIRALFPQCKIHLARDGVILAETGEYNSFGAQKIAESLGFKTKIFKDLEGQNRVIECR